MIVLWGLILGIPLLAFGGALAFFPGKARDFTMWFRSSRPMAAFLTAVAWIWTAYECDTLGIATIDRFTKAFPGELWILAAVLIPLTIAWMPKNLPVRALTGIMMLLPAELFKTTHAYRPPAGTWFAPVDLFVYAAYLGAIIGMYGMFYPWRLEKGMDIVHSRAWLSRLVGGLAALLGIGIIATGITL